MPEAATSRQAAAQAGLAARWLALGANLDLASLGLTLLALATLLWAEPPGSVRPILLLTVLAGLVEKFFALRVTFDRGIFADWSRRWESAQTGTPDDDLSAFDAALATTGLRRSAVGGRPLADRIRGAFRLLTYQAILFIMQAIALLAATLCRHGF